VSERGLRRYVEALLRGKRPPPFRAGEADIPAVRTAIDLRAASPDAGQVREEFVVALHRRLATDPDEVEPVRGGTRVVGTRRLFVGGAALAAASAAVGVVVDRSLTAVPHGPGPGTGGDTITPTDGNWQTVAASDELPDGGVQAFDLGTVVGFVERVDGGVRAVSGSCTHQGCRLRLEATSRRLDCPCHTTVFALTGELVAHQLPVAPAPLPRFATREVDGDVQVYAPALST
jgi:cytochrome b6-f complex iron-sulfur subunit